MKLNTRLILLVAGGGVLAISKPASFAPTPLPSNLTKPSAPTTSSSTPTVTLNLANPTVADMFQLGLNNGLRNLCLGNNNTISMLDGDNSTFLPDLPLGKAQAGLVTARAVKSTATITGTETITQTAFATKSTVTAVIDVLTFADFANVTSAISGGLEIGERAHARVVTVTTIETATRTAVVKAVTRTATIEIIAFASQQNLTNTTGATSSAPAPAPVIEGDGSGTPDNQTAHQTGSQQQVDTVEIFIAGFAVGEMMDNPCDPDNPPDNSHVQAGRVKFQARKRDSVHVGRSELDGLGYGFLDTTDVAPNRKELSRRHRRRTVQDDDEKRGGGGRGGGSGGSGGRGGGGGGGRGGGGGGGHSSSSGGGGREGSVYPGAGGAASTSKARRTSPSNHLWVILILTLVTMSISTATTASNPVLPPNHPPTTSHPAIGATSNLTNQSPSNTTSTAVPPSSTTLPSTSPHDPIEQGKKSKGGGGGGGGCCTSATPRSSSPAHWTFFIIVLLISWEAVGAAASFTTLRNASNVAFNGTYPRPTVAQIASSSGSGESRERDAADGAPEPTPGQMGFFGRRLGA